MRSVGDTNETEAAAPQAENHGQVGLQLRKARKISGLSPEMVALQLHIDVRVIKALENDDFSQLMPVFARGYLRNYARLVNLPADPLLESYDRIVGAEKTPPPAPQSSGRSDVRWGVYLLLLALGVPLLLWGMREGRLLVGEIPNSRSVMGPAKTTEPPTPPIAPTGPETLPAQSAASVSPIHDGTVPPSGLDNTEAVPNKPASVAAEAKNTADTPSVGQVPDHIGVHVSADTWVAIRDHNGNRLAYETIPAGGSRSYSGQAPFTVVLGNSPATRLEFNDQVFEQPKPRSGTVVRFQVGDSPNDGTGIQVVKGVR